MHKASLIDDPLWYKDALIYQTHVKAFMDSDGDGTGDFVGLTQKLDYIRDLGVNCIWLLPFYPSPMRDDGYDIADYRNVNPAYGTRRDFRRFIDAAHRRGLRVITELVINHTSDQHPWFQAARQAPRGSSKRNFYVWSDDDRRFAETRIIFTDTESSNWAWDPVAKQYYWHRFFSHQPDLNHNNPRVVKAIIRVMRFWLDQGVDGLRLDAIPYLCVRDGTSNENLPETHAVIRQMRAVVDARYRNRMFLAEANQWPEDVRDYFGTGDECHVAYHFPLMPRMYMALAQEDRHPVVEILEQTPEIPPNCQWAIFLRNHDELTLEMVSDRERDYMYQAYAADPRMRVNLGIRRRLAPLLDNDQDKLRLMHSLLLSLPGCPILYYGDELGMGDNIYLGDRNSVRTPMQWSPDRNAGFSRADPQRLYLPPVMDPIYGYQAVNVEAQEREASSLLNWMRRIIRVRKAYRVFGRGGLRLLHPGNRKILAYVREGGPGDGGAGADEVVLCVANLARGAQPVELDLSDFKGRVPVEMLCQTPFPAIGELPYLLTLPGYGFYWFLLSRDAQPPAWHEDRLPALRLKTLVLPEGWSSLQPGLAQRREPMERALAQLEGQILPRYLPTRRWFAPRAADIRAVALGERQVWGESLISLARVLLEDGQIQDYFLPLSIRWEGRDQPSGVGAPAAAALARVRRHAVPGLLYDAFADETFVRALVQAVGSGGELPCGSGQLRFTPTPDFARLPPPRSGAGLRLLTEHADSWAVLDERLLLKGYRRLRPDVGHEVEMLRYLGEASPAMPIIPLAGFADWRAANGETSVLITIQAYLLNQGDLWTRCLDLLGRLCEQGGERLLSWQDDPALMALGALLDSLGRRLAEFHLALARPTADPAFAPEPITADDLAAWRGDLEAKARTVLDRLAAGLAFLPAETRAAAEQLRYRGEELLSRLAALMPSRVKAVKTRCHGSLGLGQVLVAGNDLVLVDFAGNPERPLAERRAKRCPLVDLASLIWSGALVGRQALEEVCRQRPIQRDALAPYLARWRDELSRRLVSAYEATFQDAPGFTEGAEGWIQARALLRLFVLERALEQLHAALDGDAAAARMPLQSLLAWMEGTAQPSGPGL